MRENINKNKKLTTETNVALDLSGISFPGLSPFDRLGFFRGLQNKYMLLIFSRYLSYLCINKYNIKFRCIAKSSEHFSLKE